MSATVAIETSSRVLSIALQKGKGPVLEKKIEGFLNHAENLLPALDQLLRKQKLSPQDITTWLIGQGPGSFTGLRVGFATLKGFLALEKKKTCFGALSLDLIAEGVKLPDSTWLAVSLDAFRGKLYTRLYQRKKGAWVAKGKVQILSPQDTISFIPKGSVVTGNALERYEKEFKDASQKRDLTFLEKKFWYPRAASLITCFQRKDKKINTLKKPKDFIPLYFRLSEAEERKKIRAN